MAKKYRLVELEYLDVRTGSLPGMRGQGINIRSTDESVISWLFEEVKKRIPTATLTIRRKAIDSNQAIIVVIKNLNNQDEEAAWLLFNILCERGWEPFDVWNYGESQVLVHNFRHEEI